MSVEEIYEQALLDIIDPVGRLLREVPEGCEMDSGQALLLRNDPRHLRAIAQTAINKVSHESKKKRPARAGGTR